MKIKVEMDVSPEEFRAVLGLPDVGPLQEEMLAKVREHVMAGAAGLDPVALMKPFLTPNTQAMEGLQRAFWQALTPRPPPAGDAGKD